MLPAPVTHADGRVLMLGKGPARVDKRTLQLKDIIPLPPPPPSANWYGGVTSWGNMLNDELSDCVPAAIGHAEQVVSLNTVGGELTLPDPVIEELYEHSCGYVPGDPNTDQGGVIIDVLNYVRKNGLGHRHVDGEKRHKQILLAYADPNPLDVNHIKQAIAILGVVDLGLQLPITAQAQVGGVWDVVGNPTADPNSMPGSWGGHSVCLSAYTPAAFEVITWGSLQTMTTKFLTTYCDEAHCLLMRAWLDHFGLSKGTNLATLEQALEDMVD